MIRCREIGKNNMAGEHEMEGSRKEQKMKNSTPKKQREIAPPPEPSASKPQLPRSTELSELSE
jgi:hypothetical protein